MPLLTRLAAACAVVGTLCAVMGGAVAASQPAVEFNKDVRPIFVRHCLACHGGVKQAGGLSLVTREKALAPTDSTDAVIVAGDVEASHLLERVTEIDDEMRMPPAEHGRRLNDDEVATLRRWVAEGAKWEAPWAFRAPQRVVALPQAAAAGWGRERIDAFVLATLEDEGLKPWVEADRAQWLRRVSFDLVGLPPTEAERIAFESDLAPGAYERAVDRLLASPHFGERWASVWLDLARYADTMGFERDPPRDIWPWRDWVVGAFNADMPYNEFLLKQTAGDLLEGATIADRLATALHRNTQVNTEGGTDDEEFRWSAVVDRVDTTWQGVLGMTMGCARCHDHPYDPLWQSDYYRFAAFFNTTRDADLTEDWPKLAVPTDPAQYDEAERIDAELSSVRGQVYELGKNAAQREGVWRPLAVEKATSTGETKLSVRATDAGVEVVAVGTVTDRSVYTVECDSPSTPIAALRIDVSPLDPAAALKLPEYGFILSRLRVLIDRADKPEVVEEKVSATTKAGADEVAPTEEELMFVEVLADEAEGFFCPQESINDSSGGWGAYTRMREPRWAVFVLDKPVTLNEGDRLRVELKHDMATDGQGPLVMQRFRLSTTDNATVAALASDQALRKLREREAELVEQRKKIPSTDTPVLVKQAEAFTRQSFMLDRGAWLSPTEEVQPSTPEQLPGKASDRLALAQWMGSSDNPLTARVMVNRVWAELFGAGIVETLDDFGSTGGEPSHPELLEDLAARFRDEMGWGLKPLLRELVLSATYRQDSRISAELAQRDPSNRLLARGPRGRLRAEMVRDQALVLSGRFSAKLGGPPVMPYQPDGVWRSVYNNRMWETAPGEDRFRRAIYTYWKRTAAYPSLVAFDAPTRDQCTARRPTTNTPLQALVTLNDPAYVELAEGLADRTLARRDDSPAERIAWAAEEAAGRPLPKESVDELVKLYEESLAREGADERFALTVVANVVLNLDAVLTK